MICVSLLRTINIVSAANHQPSPLGRYADAALFHPLNLVISIMLLQALLVSQFIININSFFSAYFTTCVWLGLCVSLKYLVATPKLGPVTDAWLLNT